MTDVLALFDLGTGNSRVAFINLAGSIVAARSFTNVYYQDDAYEDARYFLPGEWWEKAWDSLHALCVAHPDADIIGASAAGARQSFVLLDDAGDAYYGMPNIDNRGKAYLNPEHSEFLYNLTGRWATEDFGAAKLVGLRQGRPEVFAQARRVLSLSEWICYELTGIAVFEPSTACESQLLDLDSLNWSDELCDLFELSPQLLPPLMAAGTILGTVRDGLVARAPQLSGTMVIVGGADTQLAVRQTGSAMRATTVVSGTTTPVAIRLPTVHHDALQRVWTNADLGGIGYLVETNPGITGLNYQRMRMQFAAHYTYEALERAYGDIESFNCTASLTTLSFARQRPTKRGGFFTRLPVAETVNITEVLWAVLADIACATVEQLTNLESTIAPEQDDLRGCGGGLQSPALAQMLADLTGRNLVLRSGFEQATLVGLSEVCRQSLGVPARSNSETMIRYAPHRESLIHRYHDAWREARTAYSIAI